ncbi:MAG: FdhF/YdeP family oxidoreductase [Ferruginibacter sp.]
MEEANKPKGAENPEDFTGLREGNIKKTAAGIPAVASAISKTVSEAGVIRGMKALFHLNKKGGYDCPSCAWPDPDDDRSAIAEYCENGARAVAEEATTKQLKEDFFAVNDVASLAALTDYEIGSKGRIAQPMYLPLNGTHYQPISWDAAFEKIGQALNNLSSPDEAIFYTSGRTSNEAAFLYQLFAKAFGTNNMPDCSNMCHESTSTALGESLGLGKASIKLDDFEKAEVIIIMGQNPGTNHPRMLTALQKAKRNGATIISVNPLPETGLMGFNNPQTMKGVLGIDSALTDIFLQIKINGDMALLKALEQILIIMEKENPGSTLDKDFIRDKTEGYEVLEQNVLQEDLKTLSQICGIDLPQIAETAEVLKKHNRIIICWAMGLTQQKNSVDTIKEIVNLLLMKGSIGKPGAGTCPVRGHSNVQGDRTVGIFEKPSQALLNAIEKRYGFRPPQEHGLDTVNSIHAMHRSKAKIFFGLGGNFLSATPDTAYTATAMRNCDLTVHVSTKLNRSHLVHGKEALILPCLSRSDKDFTGGKEQFVSCENTTGVVQMSKGVLNPVSKNLRSETAIVCGLAKATLKGKYNIPWDNYEQDYDAIRDDIDIVLPEIFQNYNKRVRIPGGFYLPNPNREGKFETETKKAKFHIGKLEHIPLKPGELMMMTIRSHDQFNTTIYGLDDRYRGIYNERRVIFMNRQDIIDRSFQDKDVVDIFNFDDGIERAAHKFIVVAYPIPQGCCATYYPETNVLVPISSVAAKSNTPTSKEVRVVVRKREVS